MYLIHFDENKYAADNPFFLIGGILLEDKKITEIENVIMQIQYNFFGTNILNKDTELHGVELFQGKNNFRNRKMAGRCENNNTKLVKWHDIELQKVWKKLKNNTDYSMQRWPK